MAGFSNYLETEIAEWVKGTAFASAPSTVYLALHASDPGDTGANEVTGNNYAREIIAFGTITDGAMSNSSDIEFNQASGSWGTISYVSVWDTDTGGNCLLIGSVTTPKLIDTGDIARFATGEVDVTIS